MMIRSGISYLLIFILVLIKNLSLFSQPEEHNHIQFYLLTYSPGKELYSTFGHSSIRYVNQINHTDIVYNYGTFDFDDPDFYTKFVRGSLNYQLSRTTTKFVIKVTQMENRCIIQNELLINEQEKIALINALERNYLPENKYYRYDFLYDNCATRIYELIDSITQNRFVIPESDKQIQSFNRLITEHIKAHPWAEFGFSLITGSQVFKKATKKECQFIPDWLLKYQSTAIDTNTHQKLLGDPETLVSCKNFPYKKRTFLNIIFISLLLLGIIVKMIEFRRGTILVWIDKMITLPYGTLGFILILLWILSDHRIFAWNYNILWANPLLYILLIPKYKSNKTIHLFFLCLSGISLALTIYFKGFYIPVITLILMLMLRIRLK